MGPRTKVVQAPLTLSTVKQIIAQARQLSVALNDIKDVLRVEAARPCRCDKLPEESKDIEVCSVCLSRGEFVGEYP